MLGAFYRAVVQAVLLFVSETWVMYPHTERALYIFLHRVICGLMGRQPIWKVDWSLVGPPFLEAMSETGLEEVETYISIFHKTYAQFITDIPIMNLCLAAEQRPMDQL